MTRLIDEALQLAAAGWPVFPLAGKLPVFPASEGGNGFRDATTDAERVRAWWSLRPGSNIGVAIPTGFVVLDVDPRHGGEDELARLVAAHGQIPLTLTTITGSGGRHLWFRTTSPSLVQRGIAPGLDTRVGGRGYVVAPPSIHPATGRTYQWLRPSVAPAPLPGWVGARLRPPESPSCGRPLMRTADDRAAGVLAWAADRVRRAPQGQRHQTLRNTAGLMGGYVADGVLRESDARAVLLSACEGWGTQRKDEKTIEAGLRWGRARPLEAS
jgi:hypothetical protein